MSIYIYGHTNTCGLEENWFDETISTNLLADSATYHFGLLTQDSSSANPNGSSRPIRLHVDLPMGCKIVHAVARLGLV